MEPVHYFASHEEVRDFFSRAVEQGRRYNALVWLSVFENHYDFEARVLEHDICFQSAERYTSIDELARGVWEWAELMEENEKAPNSKHQYPNTHTGSLYPLFYTLICNLGWSDALRGEALGMMELVIENDEEPWDEEEKRDILGFFRGENSYRSLTAKEGKCFSEVYDSLSVPTKEGLH